MRIGRYEVVATLGQGGMGVVHAARSPEGLDVAVKVLRRSEGDVLARFERERRLLASLGEAEGFVPLLEGGTAPEGPYLVMPLVPGGTLRKKLEPGPLGIEETVALGRRLALALGAAHARGIVHRDMKPENVLFTAAGAPLIADLGLAKHFDGGAPGASQSVSLSQHGALRGTAGYMAPEQMTDARSVGPAADVFSLGAILYECLAGEPPFLGESVLEVLTRVSAGRFEPLRARRPEVPGWLAAVVERALAPAALDRFPDGLALGRALAGAPGGGRRSGLLAGAVVLGGAVGAALILMVWTRRPAAPADDPRARAWQALRSGDEAVKKGAYDAAIADLDRAIALDPKLAVAYQVRAKAKFEKGNRPGATADITRAIELDPVDALAWQNSATMEEHAGNHDRAIADATRALELDPRRTDAWYNRAVSRCSKGDYDGAIADDTRAIELDPSHSEAWGNRGLARNSRGDREAAIVDLTRAIALAPKSAIHLANRGIARSALGQYDDAIADFTRAIELEPANAPAWGNRGGAREGKGDLDGAIDDLTHAIELAPNDSRTPTARAEVERLKGLRGRR
jgi:tetratricopeptide (TPR) repeat protein